MIWTGLENARRRFIDLIASREGIISRMEERAMLKESPLDEALLHQIAEDIPSLFAGLMVHQIDNHEYRIIRSQVLRMRHDKGDRDAITLAMKLIAQHLVVNDQDYESAQVDAAMALLRRSKR